MPLRRPPALALLALPAAFVAAAVGPLPSPAAFVVVVPPSTPTPPPSALSRFGGGRRRRRARRGARRAAPGDDDLASATAGTSFEAADVPSTSSSSGVGARLAAEDDRALRFSGVGRLYSSPSSSPTTPSTVLSRLASATVAIVGLGGVGSWTAEALCRSGVGHLILVDLDDVCISNANRQVHAVDSNVGRMKIDAMRSRLADINPHCDVTLVHDFVTSSNAEELVASFRPELAALVDAVDGASEKTALILACVKRGVPVVTCGGAAGRTDPTKIRVDDLTRVSEDRLLFKVRKSLRQEHGFPKVPVGTKTTVRKWRISSVYSLEVQRKAPPATTATADGDGDGDGEGDGGETSSSFRTCDGALGTACHVTAAYGLAAAGRVVDMIAKDELVQPKRQGKGLGG
ncbi:hypothetical protein ACHAWF_003876 [Thalassiosira exigua]